MSFGGPSEEHKKLFMHNHAMIGMYNELLDKHRDLQDKHAALVASTPSLARGTGGKVIKTKAPTVAGAPDASVGKAKAAALGVIRLDYDYPPAPGDIDHPGSFAYDVFYRVVPGLTFEAAQAGKLTPEVEKEFIEGVKWLVAQGVTGITGDCGFMMYFQALARQHCTKPVFMSSLAQLPAVTCGFSCHEKIALVTANGKSLGPMRDLIKEECGVDHNESRFIMVGCEDVPGFEQVALGGKVDVKKVTPGVVAKAKEVLQQHPTIRAFCFECTELPPYSDAVRAATRLPVYDSITCCNFFIAGRQDNARFGMNNWQNAWDGKQDAYKFGQNLDQGDRNKLVNQMQDMPLRPEYAGQNAGQ